MVRRPDYNKGKWQLARERHHLKRGFPPSKGSEKPISGIIRDLFEKLEVDESRWTDDLERTWSDVVGGTVSAHARPGTWQNGRLTIFVDSSVWLNELKRYSEKELLTKLQTAFGKDRIQALRLQLDPGQG